MCNAHFSTGPLKPVLLSVAEGPAHKYILSSPILSHAWLLLLVFPSQCTREAEELVYVSNVASRILYGFYTEWAL